MTDQAKKYLSDIRKSIERIDAFMVGFDTFEKYQTDLKTQSAVERQLGIIGEAAIKYRNIEGVEVLEHIQQIAGFRNRLIHAYDNMDHSVIWAILQNHLPPLKLQVERLLASN